MNIPESEAMRLQVFYRLTAMWVIWEGVAGGIMHSINLPFTGMLMAAGSVVCICLLGYIFPQKKQIIKATVIVLIFKMMLSPHSPPTAYFAVFFQGMMGYLLFRFIKSFRLACIILGVLALVESAMQRILILVILYGNDFWRAVNDYINKISGRSLHNNYMLWIAFTYFILHALAGIITGIMAANIITSLQDTSSEKYRYVPLAHDYVINNPAPKKHFIKYVFLVGYLILILLFIQSLFKIGPSILPANQFLFIILRSIFILLSWYFIVKPLVYQWIKKMLEKQKQKSSGDIHQILQILPATEQALKYSWKRSEEKKGWARYKLFWKIFLINQLEGQMVNA